MSFNINITERGNNAFSNEENSVVLFCEIEKNTYLQTAHTPMNYPAWDVSIVRQQREELVNHITYRLDGWHVDKCNLEELNIHNDHVIGIDTITDEICTQLHLLMDDHDVYPKDNVMLISAIKDSAGQLGYTLTKRMVESCIEFFNE